MKVSFTPNENLAPNEIEITISANNLDQTTMQLMQQIQSLAQPTTSLPITVDERVVLLAFTDIVVVEVFGTEIVIQTTTKSYTTKGQLKKISLRLPPHSFIQVNKSTLINVEHLDYLEAAFSGNMTAFLTNGNRVSVSRKYLPDLKRVLGL